MSYIQYRPMTKEERASWRQWKKQNRQEARKQRVRTMVKDLNAIIDHCNKECSDINALHDYDNYKNTFMAELDKCVKARLFEGEDTSWSLNDITMFLNGLEYRLDKKDLVDKMFYDVELKCNKNDAFNWDYKACPFSLLYKFFLEVVFKNQLLISRITIEIKISEDEKARKIDAKLQAEVEEGKRAEAKKQAEARLKEEAESIVREAKAKVEITEDEKWQAINEKNWETAMNEARAEMEVIA